MRTRKPRSRGVIRQLSQSGIFEAYRLDAAAVLALSLIGVSVHRLAPDLLSAYAGAVIFVAVWALGKTAAPSQKPD